MAKISGGVRILKSGSRQYTAREREVMEMQASGKYSSVILSKKGGGYVAVENGKAKHKPEELEAARFLADKGYKVTLKDETGQIKTPDGYLFKASFEQRTPEGSSARNFRFALEHARNKVVDIPVVYMKYNRHTKQSVVEGLKEYEAFNSYRFKQIVIITPDGRIHRHKHNS